MGDPVVQPERRIVISGYAGIAAFRDNLADDLRRGWALAVDDFKIIPAVGRMTVAVLHPAAQAVAAGHHEEIGEGVGFRIIPIAVHSAVAELLFKADQLEVILRVSVAAGGLGRPGQAFLKVIARRLREGDGEVAGQIHPNVIRQVRDSVGPNALRVDGEIVFLDDYGAFSER